MARYTHEEIYISYLCDQIMAACNRINKKLDVMDEQQRLFTYTVSSAPLNYSTPAYVTPGQTTADHYFHNQPTPSNDYHQQLPPPKTYQPPLSTPPTTYQPPPLTSAPTATSLLHQNHQSLPSNAHQPPPPPITHQPLQPPQTYQQHQLTCRATQMQPRRQFPQPNPCWYPATQQLHTPPQYPSYINGPTVYSGYELYKQRIPQPPDPGPPYGVPNYGLRGARPQKQDPIHPIGQPPDTGQPAIGWSPLTSHHHSAAQLSAAAVPLYRGGPLEAVVVPEKVQDKSRSEVMLFNRKSYDGDERLMVVPPSPAAISLPCSQNRDYSDHTSVPIELVDSVEFEHLGEGNDRIEVNGENKDRDRVDEKESLVLGEEENRAFVFLVVDIIEEPTYTILEVMEMREVENSLVLLAVGSHFEATFPLEWWPSMKTDGEYNWTPGGNTSHSFDCDWKKFDAFIGTRTVIQIRCHAIVGYWGTKQRSCAFDPGGESSPKLLFETLFVVSWFPP